MGMCPGASALLHMDGLLNPCEQAPYSMSIRLSCATLDRALGRHLSIHLFLPLLCHCSRHTLFVMLRVCNLYHPGASISPMGMCLGVSALLCKPHLPVPSSPRITCLFRALVDLIICPSGSLSQCVKPSFGGRYKKSLESCF